MIPRLVIPLKKLSTMRFESIAGVFMRTNRGLSARFLLTGFIALIFTAGVLQWSFQYGRLAYDITYDDVGYFQDAYSRIKALYEQGWGAMFSGLVHNPPHSPYSTMLAMTGFALFGPSDWVPYLMNGVSLFLFLGFITYILRDIPFIISIGIIIIFLCVPISFFAVHEFRPDYAVAVFTCLFAFLAFESLASLGNHDSFKLRCAGAAFGFALLCKPSFFAHTVALGLGVSLLMTLYQFAVSHRQGQREEGRRKILSILRDFYLPGIILSVPYYVMSWQHVWNYFWTYTRGEKAAIWSLKDSYWEVLKTFTINGPSSWMISKYLFLFLVIVIFSVVFFSAKKKWQDLSLLAGLMAVAIASLGIVIYGRHNNPYFSLTYQMMLCFVVCYCLSCLYGNKFWFAVIVLTFIVFTGWHMARVPLPKMVSNQTALAHKGDSANRKMINVIKGNLKKYDSNTAPNKVFVSFAGEVNANSMQWLALQESLPLQFSDLHTCNDMGAYKKAISESDFTVVADEDAVGVYRSQPSYEIQKPVLDYIRAQPALQEIMVLKTSKDTVNGYMRLYANQPRLWAKDLTVALPYPVSGFLPPEGPYPQWKLPVVRWGLYPESQILLPDKLSGSVIINLSARGQQGAKLLITLNKVEIYHHIFKKDSFEDMTIPLTVSSGRKEVGLRYDQIFDGKDKLSRSILFQNIRIIIPSLKPISAPLENQH